jgi:ATP-dependent RNA helicase DOB1
VPPLLRYGKSILSIPKKLLTSNSKMTDVYEGSLIRMFRRLEELLRQMAQGSKVMGNSGLEEKFETALKKLRRDVVAAQSLYL